MKSLIIASVVSMLAAASASAQSTSARVPTGIDVQGSTYYRMMPVMGGHRVVHQAAICDRRAIQDRDARCIYDAQSAAEATAREAEGKEPGEVSGKQ